MRIVLIDISLMTQVVFTALVSLRLFFTYLKSVLKLLLYGMRLVCLSLWLEPLDWTGMIGLQQICCRRIAHSLVFHCLSSSFIFAGIFGNGAIKASLILIFRNLTTLLL
ncbi:hypothetical protein RchiOBHm_Chr4g0412131 [Rosa chinensis]|uniref:Uncharacterized protein n=1 Tax=Rosa chinensis TaxID=74649 RepID=A0A2P6QVS6_ROSCH|nr:hypothetical protein RchiOBHm_Chr4g0412131 [Rosa chinensis]